MPELDRRIRVRDTAYSHEAMYLQFVRDHVLVDWMDLYLTDPANRRTVRLTWLRGRMGYPDWWAPNRPSRAEE